MNLADYLIDQEGKDWSELLSGWSYLLPDTVTVWLVNRFGDLFLVFEDQSVHMLDVSIGTLTHLASNRDSFCDAVDHGDNANIWLMLTLVDQCVAGGITLTENQCYGFKLPPLLGGKYNIENVEPTDMSVYYSFMADISRQAKDLPNGTKVRVVIKK